MELTDVIRDLVLSVSLPGYATGLGLLALGWAGARLAPYAPPEVGSRVRVGCRVVTAAAMVLLVATAGNHAAIEVGSTALVEIVGLVTVVGALVLVVGIGVIVAAVRRSPASAPPPLPGSSEVVSSPAPRFGAADSGQGAAAMMAVSEGHHPTSRSGRGTRGCITCDARWTSVVGEMLDSGEYERLVRRGVDVQVFASVEETCGLSCRPCGLSWCREHLPTTPGAPTPDGSATGRPPCPTCSGALSTA